MKIQYLEPKNWTKKRQKLFNHIEVVVDEFEQQGYRMTLRQLYYQLVSRVILGNTQLQYKMLSSLLNIARYYGFIDWNFIEDRGRQPRKKPDWVDVHSFMDTLNQYRRDRWINQDHYLEVWVEKEALSGILQPICDKYHVTLMVNRGYSSASAMHDASIRFRNEEEEGKETHIIYLGDHDPSGIDMVRDIEDRMNTFDSTVTVDRIALNKDQIDMYKPPPNPTKVTDPRATKYIAEFGNTSWELDALNPKQLNDLLDESILDYLDVDHYNLICKAEEYEKRKAQKIIDRMKINVDDVEEEDLPDSKDEL